MRNQLLRRPASSIGLVFSTSGYTLPAETMARFTAPQTILLWDGDEVKYGLERKSMVAGLVAKYRRSIEDGLPNYDIREEGLP